MAETIPKWSAEDERLLEELTERKQQRAYQLTKRVIDVASEIHIHNMSEDEIADGMIQRSQPVSSWSVHSPSFLLHARMPPNSSHLPPCRRLAPQMQNRISSRYLAASP